MTAEKLKSPRIECESSKNTEVGWKRGRMGGKERLKKTVGAVKGDEYG